MALTHKLILAPSESTRKMLIRRMTFGRPAEEAQVVRSHSWGAVLLVQGSVPEIFYAADVGSKVSQVLAMEVVGNCPQNIISMAFVGNVADVKQVLAAFRSEGVVV